MKTKIILFLLLVTSFACGFPRHNQSAAQAESQTGQLITTTKTNAARAGHTATLLNNGKVLIAGGMAGKYDVLASAEIFSPKANQFTATGVMKAVRYKHTAVMLANGKDGPTSTTQTWIFKSEEKS